MSTAVAVENVKARVYYTAAKEVMFSVCLFVVFLIFDVIFSIAKGVHHDGRLPFWKPVIIVVSSGFK